MDDLCRKIDISCLRQLELVQAIIDENSKLEDLMKDGYINMAKARYVMGQNSVGSLQLPNEDCELNAKYRVLTDRNNQETTFQLSTGKSDDNNSNTNDYENTARRRVTNKEEDNSLDNEEKQSEKSKKSADPINWFGVLVPTSLKQSQKSFKNALPVLCSLAELHSQLLAEKEKHEELLITKLEKMKISE